MHPRIRKDLPQPPVQSNPYTEWLCDKLDITNPVFEYVRLLEAGLIRIDPRSINGGNPDETNNSSFHSSFSPNSTFSRRSTGGSSFRGTAFNSDCSMISNRSVNDPNEIQLSLSDDEDEEREYDYDDGRSTGQ